METTFAGAAQAYTRAIDAARGAAGQPDDALQSAAGAGGSFADLLASAVNDAVQAGQAAETATVQATAGQGSLTDIVTAVTNAEITLQTVVAVRDKVIDAYQEIVRMPI